MDLNLFFSFNDLKLKRLSSYWGPILSSVEASNLAASVCRIEAVYLYDTELTTHQLNTVFSAVVDCSELQLLKLKKLMVSKNNLSAVTPDILASAVCRLEEVNLNYTKLTVTQLNAMFYHITSYSGLKPGK